MKKIFLTKSLLLVLFTFILATSAQAQTTDTTGAAATQLARITSLLSFVQANNRSGMEGFITANYSPGLLQRFSMDKHVSLLGRFMDELSGKSISSREDYKGLTKLFYSANGKSFLLLINTDEAHNSLLDGFFRYEQEATQN